MEGKVTDTVCKDKDDIKNEVDSFKPDGGETLFSHSVSPASTTSTRESLKEKVNSQLHCASAKLNNEKAHLSHLGKKIEAVNNSDILKVWGDKALKTLKLKTSSKKPVVSSQ